MSTYIRLTIQTLIMLSLLVLPPYSNAQPSQKSQLSPCNACLKKCMKGWHDKTTPGAVSDAASVFHIGSNVTGAWCDKRCRRLCRQ